MSRCAAITQLAEKIIQLHAYGFTLLGTGNAGRSVQTPANQIAQSLKHDMLELQRLCVEAAPLHDINQQASKVEGWLLGLSTTGVLADKESLQLIDELHAALDSVSAGSGPI